MSHNVVELRRRHQGGFDVNRTALQLLKQTMEAHGRITDDDIRRIARETHQPEAIVYGVATYYSDLGMQPRGRSRVWVCKGTACFAACQDRSVTWFEKSLNIKLGETSADGAVSLEPVYCLGFCNAGPSARIGSVVALYTPCSNLTRREPSAFRSSAHMIGFWSASKSLRVTTISSPVQKHFGENSTLE